MTNSEKMDLILAEIQCMKKESQGMKGDIQDLKSEMQDMKRRTTNIELHLENITDRNVQIMAENGIELTNKLNEAIPAVDKNLAYEVKVNYLVGEVDKIKHEITEIRNKIA